MTSAYAKHEPPLTEAQVDAALGAYDCPGPIKCAKPRESKDRSPDIWPCVDCKAPARIMVGNTMLYRSYSDYCDD